MLLPDLVLWGGVVLLGVGVHRYTAARPTSLLDQVEADIATGNARYDRYDDQIAAGLVRARAPRWMGPLVKVMCWRESDAWRAVDDIHDDGFGLGMMGIHRDYYGADDDPPEFLNPHNYTDRQLLESIPANVEVGSLLLIYLLSYDVGVWTAVEQFNRGRGGANRPGDYARATAALVDDWFGGLE